MPDFQWNGDLALLVIFACSLIVDSPHSLPYNKHPYFPSDSGDIVRKLNHQKAPAKRRCHFYQEFMPFHFGLRLKLYVIKPVAFIGKLLYIAGLNFDLRAASSADARKS